MYGVSCVGGSHRIATIILHFNAVRVTHFLRLCIPIRILQSDASHTLLHLYVEEKIIHCTFSLKNVGVNFIGVGVQINNDVNADAIRYRSPPQRSESRSAGIGELDGSRIGAD